MASTVVRASTSQSIADQGSGGSRAQARPSYHGSTYGPAVSQASAKASAASAASPAAACRPAMLPPAASRDSSSVTGVPPGPASRPDPGRQPDPGRPPG